jgi:hypothetical protein
MRDQKAALKEPAFPIELAAHHMVVALVGLIQWWLDNHLKLSVEEMARVYQRLIIRATWNALEHKDYPSPLERS